MTGPEQTGLGHLRWDLTETVTGNADAPGTAGVGTLFGTLEFNLTLQNGNKIEFESTCILEAGVFNTTEQDPFGVETTRTVRRGIEGEWQGWASNFPAKGQSSKVVVSISTWTTTDTSKARFKVDIATASATVGACANETLPNAGIGGPTTTGGWADVDAPNLSADRATCFIEQQQQQD